MLKILIVDDQSGIRALLKELFVLKGYEVVVASNGQQALEFVQKAPPEIVLLDMKIPGMDGLQVLKRLREQVPAARVIMMTAYGELGVVREAMRLGAVKMIAKPFDIHELCAIVESYVLEAKCV